MLQTLVLPDAEAFKASLLIDAMSQSTEML